MNPPWKEWIPGVLNKPQMTQLCDEAFIVGDGPVEVADHSSIDLSLSNEAFRMINGSVKPQGKLDYGRFITHEKLAEPFDVATGGTLLKAKETYVFKLRERIRTQLSEGPFHGQATAKSSIGRVDVLARLIVDGMDSYEEFTPEGLQRGSGEMYLEVTPITFNVRIKPGISLTQLRLFYGNPAHVQFKGTELFNTLLHGSGQEDGSLSVDLSTTMVGQLPVAAFCANLPSSTCEPIPLWKEEDAKKPDPCQYWRFVETDSTKRLKIEPENFYLLRSKEKISVPPGIAIYCRASDETIGEMRIHYAGFAHPFFGWHRPDSEEGTPLMFEVRGHQVPVTLGDGEKMANLLFYRMSEDCKADDQGKKSDDSYQKQKLELSKFFKSWPSKLKRNSDGTVEAAS